MEAVTAKKKKQIWLKSINFIESNQNFSMRAKSPFLKAAN